jgi:hypothetical protein
MYVDIFELLELSLDIFRIEVFISSFDVFSLDMFELR